jgi:lysophospholipase L1-like esterase
MAPDSLATQLATADRTAGNRLLSSNALLPLLRRALTQRGIPYVDLLDQFARLAPPSTSQDLYLWPHDHHLSRAGHRFLAEAIAAYLHRHPLLAP